MIPLADGIYTAEQASRDSATVDILTAMLITVAIIILAAWALSHLRRRDERHGLVPMRSERPDVYGAGQFGHRTNSVADAYETAAYAEARAADAEALLAMEKRRIMRERWEAQQAAERHARREAIEVETLEAWYARQSSPRWPEIGR